MARTESGERRRTYAEWYVWAARNLSSAGEVRHACAEAATDAKEEGEDPASAARAAAKNRSGAGWANQAPPATRAYAEWYDWARTTLNVAGERLHAAAAAALAECDRGGDATAASEAARRSAAEDPDGGGPPPSAPLGEPTSTASPVSSPQSPPAPPPTFAARQAASSEAPPLHPAPAYGAPPLAPPVAYPPAYAYGPPPYPATSYGGRRALVEVPVWVAVLIGFGAGMTILIWPGSIVGLLLSSMSAQSQLAAVVSTGVSLVMFIFALLAVIGIVARGRWARVMSIVAGATFCTSPVVLVVYSLSVFSLGFAVLALLAGLAVIIGAALARPRGAS